MNYHLKKQDDYTEYNKMCIICVQLQTNKLTAREAAHNLGEMVSIIGDKHTDEVVKKIIEKTLEKKKEEEDEPYEYTGFGD